MADWYDKTLTLIGRAQLDLSSLSDPRILALEAGYTPDFQTHEFYTDVTNILAEASLTNVTVGSDPALPNWVDCDDPVFPALVSGTVVAFVVYENTGVLGESPLLFYIDSGVILPYESDGISDLLLELNQKGIAEL